ncbi:MAG: hypothetical protein HZY77_16450 [Thiobacillus sp.]|uniref:hypothetical protein n=1 Tax=Thiobacillus sp. TaxID=924 RepID=UPI00168C1CC2|nr:hypothetical protein [Thiobacillus sp.]QLQ04119.1 MAG: hypothetical protein HZY77_16450 [Thiobacillus sp.]
MSISPVALVGNVAVVTSGRDVVQTSGVAWMRFQRPMGVRNLPARIVVVSVIA